MPLGFGVLIPEGWLTIGVGMACSTPPLPPNRTGGFPASGSPVGDFPPCHIADLLMRDWLASPRLRLLGRSVQVPRSSYWYISDGQVAPCPCVRFVVSGYSAIAFVSSRP